jgi:hypothetical protein
MRDMNPFKSAVGIIGALIPVVYCGGLIYYFVNGFGSVSEAQANGLGPTLLGLAVVGGLFCIALLVKIVRIILAARATPASGRRARSDTSAERDFDADEVIARHMARQSAQATADSPMTPSAHDPGAPANRPTFGRKLRPDGEGFPR